MNTPDLVSSLDPATSRGEVLISVQNVGKKFCRDLKKSLWYGIQDIATEFLPGSRPLASPTAPAEGRLRNQEFWAVKDVSFELRRGECLGLIGRNGAGKTTLLKILNGLIKPDHGRVEMRGKTGAMIALGAGFNPVLTGRENIYVTGSIRGMSKKEIDSKIEDIIDFAEVRNFIDMPVQSYSSGMQVRLGFAVASSLNPDILLIDEVLAVGDEAFKFKCLRRIDELKNDTAIILVSHNMQQIARVCQKAIVMYKGEKVADGTVAEGVEAYEKINLVNGEKREMAVREIADPVTSLKFDLPEAQNYGEPFKASFSIKASRPLENFCLLVRLIGPDRNFAVEIEAKGMEGIIAAGDRRFDLESERLFLRPGVYSLELRGFVRGSPKLLVWMRDNSSIRIEGTPCPRETYYQLRGSWTEAGRPG